VKIPTVDVWLPEFVASLQSSNVTLQRSDVLLHRSKVSLPCCNVWKQELSVEVRTAHVF
jgi:hypothetical protein